MIYSIFHLSKMESDRLLPKHTKHWDENPKRKAVLALLASTHPATLFEKYLKVKLERRSEVRNHSFKDFEGSDSFRVLGADLLDFVAHEKGEYRHDTSPPLCNDPLTVLRGYIGNYTNLKNEG